MQARKADAKGWVKGHFKKAQGKFAKRLVQQLRTERKRKAAEGGDPAASAPGPLVGFQVRIVGEELGEVAFGKLGDVTQHSGNQVLVQVLNPWRSNQMIACRADQVEDTTHDKERWPRKTLQLSKDEKVAAQLKFHHEELRLWLGNDDYRLTAQVVDLGFWILARELPSTEVLVLPAERQTVLLMCQGERAGEEKFKEITRRILLQLEGKKLLVVPVYADEHWTLLCLRRDDVTSPSFQVFFVDSSQLGVELCRVNAEAFLVCLQHAAVALELPFEYPPQFPPRCNAYRQENGKDCGLVCLHYADKFMRQLRGEGTSCGWPKPLEWLKRLKTAAGQITKDAALVAREDTRRKNLEVALADECKRMAELEAKLLQKKIDMVKLAEWSKQQLDKGLGGVRFGCHSCRWTLFGSTCCNPDKKVARQRAEEQYAKEHNCQVVEKMYDQEVYLKLLEEIVAARAPLNLAGGGGKDLAPPCYS